MKVSKNNFSTFAPNILSRGREYFKDGKVSIISKTKNEVIADVQGTQMYRVILKFDDDNNLVDSECNCPYLRPCKHKAAVLFKLASEETQLLKEAVSKAEGTTFDKIKRSIEIAYSRRSIELIEKAKDEIIRHSMELSNQEKYDLSSLLIINIHRGYYVNTEKMYQYTYELIDNLHLDNEELKKFFLLCLKQNSLSSNYGLGEMFRVFYESPKYTLVAQEAFASLFREDEGYAKNIISSSSFSISKRDLPIYPSFAVILIKIAPLSVSPKFYKKAIESAMNVADIVSMKEILRYFNRTHNQKYIPEEAYEYLAKRGHEDVLDNILLVSFFEYDSDFKSYLRLRKYYKEENFQKILPELESFLHTKDYINAVLLKDGDLFPGLSYKFSLKKLTCEEIYLCRDNIKEKYKEKIRTLIIKRISELTEKGKAATADIFYGLLYLEHIKDFSLNAVLFDQSVIKATSNKKELRALWLGMIARNNLYTKAGIIPYEVKYVSK